MNRTNFEKTVKPSRLESNKELDGKKHNKTKRGNSQKRNWTEAA